MGGSVVGISGVSCNVTPLKVYTSAFCGKYQNRLSMLSLPSKWSALFDKTNVGQDPTMKVELPHSRPLTAHWHANRIPFTLEVTQLSQQTTLHMCHQIFI